MAGEDRPAYSFRTAPPEAVTRFVQAKGERISFSWADVEPQEHAVAFTVAKAAQTQVLGAIRDEVERAIAEGRTLAEFRRDLEPQLRELGWWGRQTVTDPLTGETREVQLGSPRRLRTIYEANLRAARAAGQWERIERTRDVLPFLLYLLGPSAEHRPAHEAQSGTVRAATDPWWQHWFPPNGWGCKCHVRQIGAAEAERRGITAPSEPETRDWTNPRTGETRRVAVGVDPAWSGNPGLTRQRNAERHLAGELASAHPDLARVALADIARSWRVQRLALATADDAAALGRAPVALAPAAPAGGASPIVEIDAADMAQIREADERIGAPELARVQALIDAAPPGPGDRIEVEAEGLRLTLERDPDGPGWLLKSLVRVAGAG